MTETTDGAISQSEFEHAREATRTAFFEVIKNVQ